MKAKKLSLSSTTQPTPQIPQSKRKFREIIWGLPKNIWHYLITHKKTIVVWIISVLVSILIGLFFNNGIIYYHHYFPNFFLFKGTDYKVSIDGDQPSYIYPSDYDLSVFITNHWFESLPTVVKVYIKPSDNGFAIEKQCNSNKCDMIVVPSQRVEQVSVRLSITNKTYTNYELCVEGWENDNKVNNFIDCNPFYLQKVPEAK